MSAIFGAMTTCSAGLDPEILPTMAGAVQHYGSELAGLWQQGVVGLGAALQRFTHEDAHEVQPLIHETRRWVLVWDGRLDNRNDLAAQLHLGSVGTLADSVLVMRAWERWGEQCLSRLVGVFAFVLWDGNLQQSFLVRSAICAPTLYFFRMRDSCFFGSSPRLLFAVPGVQCRINEQKLADMLVFSPADPCVTWFEGIQRIPTGTILTISSSGSLCQRTFWEPPLDYTLKLKRTEDYHDAFRELLDSVVASQCRSSATVGVMMSGGLDSTAVAATAALSVGQQGRLPAYTAVWHPQSTPIPSGYYADERPYLDAMSRQYANLDIHLIDTEGVSFLDDIDECFNHLERYFSNTRNRGWMEKIYRQAATDGVNVLLNGAQGNLTISRDGSDVLSSLVMERRWGAWLGQAAWLCAGGHSRRVLGSLLSAMPPAIQMLVRHRFARVSGTADSGAPLNSAIHPQFAKQYQVVERSNDPSLIRVPSSRHTPRLTSLRALQLQDIGIFDHYFRSRFGIDPRTPLADVRIAEFTLSLPPHIFMHRGNNRLLVRDGLSDRLPLLVRKNQGRGLQGADWFDRFKLMQPQLREEVALLERHDLSRRALNIPRMHQLLDALSGGATNSVYMVEYHHVLERGIMVGRFLRWVERQQA